MNSPERVSNAIAEVNEMILTDVQQVAGVEVHITLLEDIAQLLFLGLLQVSRVTNKWRFCCYFSHQESRFT